MTKAPKTAEPINIELYEKAWMGGAQAKKRARRKKKKTKAKRKTRI